MKNIVHIKFDDWEGIYLNGYLVSEGHRIQLKDLLPKLGFNYEFKFFEEDYELPKKLNDLPL